MVMEAIAIDACLLFSDIVDGFYIFNLSAKQMIKNQIILMIQFLPPSKDTRPDDLKHILFSFHLSF